MLWHAHTYAHTFRNYLFLCEFDAFHYSRGLPTHLFVCVSPCMPAISHFSLSVVSLSTCTPSVFLSVFLKAGLSLTVCFCPSVLSDISVLGTLCVCVPLANQSNEGGFTRSCCCVELLKSRIQKCTQTH